METAQSSRGGLQDHLKCEHGSSSREGAVRTEGAMGGKHCAESGADAFYSEY